MKKLDPSVAQQIAQAASAFEQRRTGHTPQSVAVIRSENTLVITLRGALSPAEKALAKSPAGAAQVQEFQRQLFIDSADTLREEIKRITGAEVREATAEVEPTSGGVAVLLLVGVAGAGLCRGWFQLSTDTANPRPNATISVDKDKTHEDEQKSKDNLRHFGQVAKEKVGERTGKPPEAERRP
jgi:uncharacterized protein YbcI